MRYPERHDDTGYRYRTARREHVCRECGVAICIGERYLEDDYGAPFGNGYRFCVRCGSMRWQDRPSWQREQRAAQGGYGTGA